jgi:hypothetical protein
LPHPTWHSSMGARGDAFHPQCGKHDETAFWATRVE